MMIKTTPTITMMISRRSMITLLPCSKSRRCDQACVASPTSSVLLPGGEPRHIETVQTRGIISGDLRLLIFRHSRQDLRQDLSGLRERGFAMGIVGAPHHIVDADYVP